MFRMAVSRRVAAAVVAVVDGGARALVAPSAWSRSACARRTSNVRLMSAAGAPPRSARSPPPLRVHRSVADCSFTSQQEALCTARSVGGARRFASSGGQVSRTAALRRLSLWDDEAARQRRPESAETVGATIHVTVDGRKLEVPVGWRPSTLLSDPEYAGAVVARVRGPGEASGQLLDLGRQLEAGHDGLELELLGFDTAEGRAVFWHSSAHVLGQALEAYHGDDVLLCDGPALEEGGFFYEMHLAGEQRITEADYGALERLVKRFVKKRQAFQRLEVTREFAAEVFGENKFKLEMLSRIPEGEPVTLYRCGEFVDLCRGPHLPHTGLLKGFTVYRSSGSHWRSMDAKGGGQASNADSPSTTEGALLQRAYGTAFPSKEELKAWQERMEEARKRDHRTIGKQQGLFFFHELSPGSAFMLPHGTVIYNRLVDMLREEYRRRGYDEVMTPLIYKQQLWQTSGHLDNYNEDMFMVTPGMTPAGTGGAAHTDGEQHATHTEHTEHECMGLKPMNCPGHCLMVASQKLSYNDLPVRIADFSTLHRNEASGALGGLTRLRRFQQDDAHVFCTHEQIADEVQSCIEFVESIYRLFGFKFRLFLSTRPDKSMGLDAEWEAAEESLVEALRRTGKQFDVDAGGGAFYGPKIDVAVTDAIGREHQCATIQLDFQLPQRFKLSFTGPDGKQHTPVIIHRAILGSVERMMGILIEHTAGKWPFWLNPRQVAVCPVADRHTPYARAVTERLREAGLEVVTDASNKTLPKRIRSHQLLQTSLILVVGDREVDDGTVAVRYRDNDVAVHATRAARAVLDRSGSKALDVGVADSLREAGMLEGSVEADGRAPVHTLSTPAVVALCGGMRELELELRHT